MNEKNLIPLNARPKSDQRKIQQMGVEAAKTARKEKSTIQKILKQWADNPVTVKALKKEAENYGLDTNEGRSLLTLALIKGAMQGNTKYMERVLTLLGEDNPASAEAVDDGFMEAIKGSASSDWEDDDV